MSIYKNNNFPADQTNYKNVTGEERLVKFKGHGSVQRETKKYVEDIIYAVTVRCNSWNGHLRLATNISQSS